MSGQMAERSGLWSRVAAALPMRTALLGVATVWALGCVWSFQEQSAFAAAKGFGFPHLLPLVVDGFAVSMAGVAWAASLDARPAVPARLGTLLAVAGSSASNGVWAWLRANHDPAAVVLGVAVPVAAMLAFEVLLAELRRQVQRRRGLPPPVAVPYPRLIRLALAPWQTFTAWRQLVMAITAVHLADGHADVTPVNDDAAGDEPGAPDAEPLDEQGRARWWSETTPGSTASGVNGHREQLGQSDRARLLLAAGVGRRRLARELGTTEHQARQLLARERARREPTTDQLATATARAGNEEGRP